MSNSTLRETPRRSISLTWKFMAALIGVSTATAAAIGGASYMVARSDAIAIVEHELATAIDVRHGNIERYVQSVRDDLAYLTSVASVRNGVGHFSEALK